MKLSLLMCLFIATTTIIANLLKVNSVFLLHHTLSSSLFLFQNGNSSTALPLNSDALCCSSSHFFTNVSCCLNQFHLQTGRSNSLKWMLCHAVSRGGRVFSADISTMQTIRNRLKSDSTALITSFLLTNRHTKWFLNKEKQYVHHLCTLGGRNPMRRG